MLIKFIVKSNLKGIHVFINNSSLKGELNDSISSITSSTHQTEIGVEDLKNNTRGMSYRNRILSYLTENF